jgi:hypothetical protein
MDRLKFSPEQIDDIWKVLCWLEPKGGREYFDSELSDGTSSSFVDFAFTKTAPGNHWVSLSLTLEGRFKFAIGDHAKLNPDQQSTVSWIPGELEGLWRVWAHEGRLLTFAGGMGQPGWQPLGAERPRLRLSALAERLSAPVAILHA